MMTYFIYVDWEKVIEVSEFMVRVFEREINIYILKQKKNMK